MKKMARRVWIILLSLVGAFLVLIVYKTFPLINGYAAKTMCSAFFISKRSTTDVSQHELGDFPFSLSSVQVNEKDSSAQATILGIFKRKAIYREGLGATLLSGITEDALHKQHFDLPAAPVINQDSLVWPQGNRVINPVLPSLDTLRLDSATRALVVLYNDSIVFEKYAHGFTARTKQLGWSMTKGIENALLGILVRENKLKVDMPAPIEQWKADSRKYITISDLMHMSSGLHYASSAAGPSDLTDMLFTEPDMAAFAMKAAAEHPVGTIFHYADASANILSFIERKITGDNNYYKLPYEKLFYKIGMNSAVMEVDPGGNFVGSSYCYATARDWARFGLLYLHDGTWNGERILPEGWISFTAKPGSANNEEKKGAYGALWWSNATTTNSMQKNPHVPADAFSCQGYEGQFVWVIPSKKLVVVRLALDRKNIMDQDAFLSGIIKALPQ